MLNPVKVFFLTDTGRTRTEHGVTSYGSKFTAERSIYTDRAGKEMTWAEAPVGACREREPYFDNKSIFMGPDDRQLELKLPNGDIWWTDMRASNCTMRDDNVHRCWVRHGKPEDGTLHIDKNGVTCGAGAGSIVSTPIDGGRQGWHGFLHNGQFTSC